MNEVKVSIPKQVMARRVGEEVVLLDLVSGTYFGLDPIGSRIWDLLVEGKSTTEVAALLLAEYEVPAEELQADLDNLLRDLLERGLISTDDRAV